MKVIFLITCLLLALASAQRHGDRPPFCKRPFPNGKAPIIPHPSDCTKYLECHWEGYLYEKQCPKGQDGLLRYDPGTTWCLEKLGKNGC